MTGQSQSAYKTIKEAFTSIYNSRTCSRTIETSFTSIKSFKCVNKQLIILKKLLIPLFLISWHSAFKVCRALTQYKTENTSSSEFQTWSLLQWPFTWWCTWRLAWILRASSWRLMVTLTFSFSVLEMKSGTVYLTVKTCFLNHRLLNYLHNQSYCYLTEWKLV